MKDTSALDDALSGRPRLKPLSPREVMEYMLQGYSRKEIAVALGSGEGTVASHIKVIRGKLHVVRRGEKPLTGLGSIGTESNAIENFHKVVVESTV